MKQSWAPWILTLTALGLLLPYLLFSFFNIPSSDDFLYARWQREWGTVDANITCYVGWGGRYFSNLLLTTCNPLAYSTNFQHFLVPYQIHSVLLLAGLALATYYWVNMLAPGVVYPFSFALILVGFIVALLGNLAEFLYWMAGSYTYCYGLIFGLMALYYLFGVEPKVIKPQKRANHFPLLIAMLVVVVFAGICLFVFRKCIIAWLNVRPWLFLIMIAFLSGLCLLMPMSQAKQNAISKNRTLLASVCFFMSIGSNEVYAFVLVPFVGLYLLLEFWNTRKFNLLSGILLLLALLASGLNLLAPSTFARQKLQTGKTSFHITHMKSLATLLDYFATLPVIFALLVGLLIWFPAKGNFEMKAFPTAQSANKSYSVLILILSLIVVFSLSVLIPVFLSVLSGAIPDRTKNPLYFISALILLVPANQLAKYLLATFNKPKWQASAMIIAGFISIFYFGNHAKTIQYLNSGQAALSLQTDKIRFQQIAVCQSDTCIISRNPYVAPGLKSAENAVLDNDPASWKKYKDFSFATYFGKKSIIAR